MRVSRSVFDDNVEFQTSPTRAVFIGGSITVFHMSAGPLAGVISPELYAGPD